jgi:hypothetical protein
MLGQNDVFIETQQLPLVNIEALDQAIRAACPNFTGLSTGKRGVALHFSPNVTSAERETARQIAENHDPEQLTPRQQAEMQRRQQLDQARTNYGVNPLDLTAYNSQGVLIQQLAQKISWLEQEIADQRIGG